jgi:hypothetical protein
MATFHEWLQRLQACIDSDGEYVKSTFFDSKNFNRISAETEILRGGLNTLYNVCTYEEALLLAISGGM